MTSPRHFLDLADLDGDGLKDIVVGKRFWAHGTHGDPEPDAPAVARVEVALDAEARAPLLVPSVVALEPRRQHLALDVARRLERYLNGQGIRTSMTRTTDV